jgi:deferrochelatase/peroxidase EfeB
MEGVAMPAPGFSSVAVDLANVQGLVHAFYPCECARYLLFSLGDGNDRVDGRGFLRGLLPRVTVAQSAPAVGATFVNVGLSFEGLQRLGVEPAVLDEFPDDFRNGPDHIALGDVGVSAPGPWRTAAFPSSGLHVLVQLTSHTDDDIASTSAEVLALAAQTGVRELPASSDGVPIDGRHLGGGRLHFGYRDGISQPDVAWSDGPEGVERVNFRHFVLGYSTAAISSSPKVVASRPTSSADAVELVRDGCYAMFKWIYQDVARFNQFLETEGPRLAPSLPVADAQELLAAKLMGRWRDGTPLVLSPDHPSPDLVERNDFSYRTTDPDGVKCPFAAHVRVVNPRDQELSPAEFGVVPRVIRRGTPFGPPLTGTTDDGKLRGLVGVFLCASITAQIYKLTAWMKRTDFSPQFSNPVGQDPLASRQVPGASATFDIPATSGAPASIQLVDFTRTLGTAFFLLPGLSGLRRLARPAP